ncbi:MAG: hypothetical protein RIM83_08250 [Allomuricauda sp.]
MKKYSSFELHWKGLPLKYGVNFLVPSNTTFYRLHHIIQIVMGWENYHLYEITLDSYRIGQQFEDDGFNGPNKIIDSKTITIGDVLQV